VNRLLLLGSTGSIGQAIHANFAAQGWDITPVQRGSQSSQTTLGYVDGKLDFSEYHEAPYDAVCWASGINFNDSIKTFDEQKHMVMYEANCLYIIKTINQLLTHEKLAPGARLCMIGSIWQTVARENKLSYMVTKSALTGLVNSLALDLAGQGILVNCIMPGALDTTMTRQNLTPTQITAIENQTNYRKLTNMDDVAHLAYFLCSKQNTSITAQCLAVDMGFSHAKII
jgi:hypothetical protein